MKNKILCLILCFILILSCACSKAPDNKTDTKPQEQKEELYNYEVTDEPFESIELKADGMGNYYKYSNEAEMFDDCELVVVAMPINTYTDDKVIYYGKNGEIVSHDDDWLILKTIREIKIIEVLKGDTELSTVEVSQLGGIMENENGDKIIAGVPTNDFIQKKNAKYIYYLQKETGNTGYYYAVPDQGVVNIDGLDKSGLSDVSGTRMSEVIKNHNEVYKKYNRTNEFESK